MILTEFYDYYLVLPSFYVQRWNIRRNFTQQSAPKSWEWSVEKKKKLVLPSFLFCFYRVFFYCGVNWWRAWKVFKTCAETAKLGDFLLVSVAVPLRCAPCCGSGRHAADARDARWKSPFCVVLSKKNRKKRRLLWFPGHKEVPFSPYHNARPGFSQRCQGFSGAEMLGILWTLRIILGWAGTFWSLFSGKRRPIETELSGDARDVVWDSSDAEDARPRRPRAVRTTSSLRWQVQEPPVRRRTFEPNEWNRQSNGSASSDQIITQ